MIVRSMGAAWRGAVFVVGGGEKVREPRLPELIPPPILASASAGARASAAASPRILNKRVGRAKDDIRNLEGWTKAKDPAAPHI